MTAWTIVVSVSILIRVLAVAWATLLLIRHRDRWLGVFTGVLGLTVARQVLSFFARLDPAAGWFDPSRELLSEIPALLVSFMLLLAVRVVDHVISTSKDEPRRLQDAETRLRQSEQRLRLMLEQLPAVVWTTDRDLRFTSSMGAGLGKLSLEPGEVVGKTLSEYFETEDAEFPSIKAHRQALAGSFACFEIDWGGQSFHVAVEPLRGDGDAVVGTIGVALDVTDMMASERALRKSEERYRDFLEQTSEGIWRLELAQPMSLNLPEEKQIDFFYRLGSLAECSDAFAQMYGLAKASVLIGARLDEILPRSDPRNRHHLRAFIRRGYNLADAESRETDERGRHRHFVNSLTGIVENGHLVRLWGTKRNVTEHLKAEQALKASEEKYREIFEASQDTIFISTPEGRFLDINPAGVALLGYNDKEELLRVNIERDLYLDPRERQRIRQILDERGSCRDYELKLRRQDGAVLVVLETTTAVRDSSGEILAYRGMLRDVTEQRMLQQQVLRSQRMEAVGRLAGGVAHDFNNLLTVINGRSDLLRTLLEPGSPLVREIDEIKEAGKRAAALTRQLLILSRRQVGTSEAVNLNRMVENVEHLLRRSIGERIELVTHLEPELGNVKADPGQMEQVLLNLALNARDSMPHGGTLTLETENLTVNEGSALHSLGLKAIPHVVLRVEDTGKGIDPSIKDQLFEPFVSTKAPGEGTGLGLSTVYSIVQQGHGHIRVESEPGRGACFEIFLPAIEAPAVPSQVEEQARVSPRGSETILLVEDEVAVRSLLRRFLDTQGYRVLEAPDGELALEQAENRRGQIDLLLTDLVMPGIGGFELARQMESRWPGLKILYMSGYSEDAVGMSDSDPLMDSNNFLQKPFSTELLARRVRSILDSG